MPFPLGGALLSAGRTLIGAGASALGRLFGGGGGAAVATGAMMAAAAPPMAAPVAAAAARAFGAVRGAGRALVTRGAAAARSPIGRVVGGLANVAVIGSLLVDATTGEVVGTLPRRRRRGITATELRGFRKVNGLLCRVGMVPKRTARRKC